jgi:ferrous iron transport protein A
VFDRQIEELQNKLTEEKGFIPVSHQLNIFGICKKCGKRENNKEVKAIRRSLAEIKAGESGKIVEIEDGEKMLKMAESLGIRKDKVVKKISGQFMKGPVIIQIGKTKVGLGFKMAQKIMVEIRKDA